MRVGTTPVKVVVFVAAVAGADAAVEAAGSGLGTRSARVIESSAPVTASRTRTQRTLTVQRALRSQMVPCSGSSDAQTIGAIGPSRARSTSLIRISAGSRVSS